MAAKVSAIRKVKVDPRALELKSLREEIRKLERAADGLKTDLVKEYGLGAHPGFAIIEKTRSMLDKDLLEDELGDLAPFKRDIPAIYIEFTKDAA